MDYAADLRATCSKCVGSIPAGLEQMSLRRRECCCDGPASQPLLITHCLLRLRAAPGALSRSRCDLRVASVMQRLQKHPSQQHALRELFANPQVLTDAEELHAAQGNLVSPQEH